MSDYRIQVVKESTGELAATWQPGSTTEKDFLKAVVENAQKRGIGAMIPKWLVVQRLEKAFEEELLKIKKNVRP